jgi:hypothetical protein
MKDYDLWPLYVIGALFNLPTTPPTQYLTLSLKGLGFDTFKTNLLVIPSSVFHIFTLIAITYFSEVVRELSFTTMFSQIWTLPFLVHIYVVDINSINKWKAWGIMTGLLSFPYRKFFD